MRARLMILLAVLVLAILNYGIYEKEQIKAHGDTLWLELAPVDPRSLMQGDYMRLRYALAQKVSADSLARHQKRGYLVIRPDAENVAQFVRFHDGGDLKAGEKLLHFHKRYRQVRIVPDSFFFQEGHGKYYENARYGVFKFDGAGRSLLVGLADEHKEVITPGQTDMVSGSKSFLRDFFPEKSPPIFAQRKKAAKLMVSHERRR